MITEDEFLRVLNMLRPAMPSDVWIVKLHPDVYEMYGKEIAAPIEFARWYNARHPERKISSRRLSRPQKAEAVRRWQAAQR